MISQVYLNLKKMKETISDKPLSKALKIVIKGKKSQNPQLLILMGLPGSGKSYVANYLNEKYGFSVISGENVTYALFGTEKCSDSEYALAYKMVRKAALKLLKVGYSVVIDGTNLKYAFREEIYKEVENSFKPHVLYLYIDEKTAIKRITNRGENFGDIKKITSQCSEETYRNFKKQLEEPGEEECSFKIKSDNNVFERVDSIIDKL